MISLMHETPRRKKKILHEPMTVENKIFKIEQEQYKNIRKRKIRAVKSVSPARSLIEEMEVDKEEDGERAVMKTEVPLVKPRKTRKMKKRREEILSKICAIEVCKPEICCADLEGKLSLPTAAQTSFRRVGKAIYFFVFHASLGTSWTDKITRSPLNLVRDPIIPYFLGCAALFEFAMATLCNFLSHLSTDSDNKKYRGG